MGDLVFQTPLPLSFAKYKVFLEVLISLTITAAFFTVVHATLN